MDLADVTTLPRARTTPGSARPAHLQRLEAEGIHILREIAGQAERPVMLYSIGKDSGVMLHLAMKAAEAPNIPQSRAATTQSTATK